MATRDSFLRQQAINANNAKKSFSKANLEKAADVLDRHSQHNGVLSEILDLFGDLTRYHDLSIPLGEKALLVELLSFIVRYSKLRESVLREDVREEKLPLLIDAVNHLSSSSARFAAEVIYNTNTEGNDLVGRD